MIAATILAVALNSTIVASKDSRCNDIHTGAIQGQLANFAQHPAAPKDQAERGAAIAQAQTDAQTERVILAGVCSQDDYLPIAARLFALDAWADLLAERNASDGASGICPAADKKVMAATAASAWSKLAQAASIPKPPAIVATLTPQVQAMANQAGMTLPAFGDATQFWQQQYQTAAKAAVVDCASQQTPTPMPHA
ncbi:MAG TPA: hypothetical protein VF741_09650 [Candidatus Aquilonibacter sp.]